MRDRSLQDREMSLNRETMDLPFDIPPLIGTTIFAAFLFIFALVILRMLAHFLLLVLGLFFRNRESKKDHPIEKGAATGLGYLAIFGAVFYAYQSVGLIPSLIAAAIIFCLHFFWFQRSKEPHED